MSTGTRGAIPPLRAAVIVTLICVASCGYTSEPESGLGGERPERPTIEQLAELAVVALVENDEDVFVRLHVQPGDMTPNREFLIAAGAGKPLPDAAWDAQVREAFKQARLDLERVTGELEGLSYLGVRDVEEQDEGARGGRFYRLRVNAGKEAKTTVLTFMSGMESQRGWVFVDDPVVRVELP